MKCLLYVTSVEKRFITMHHVDYIYVRLYSVPYRPALGFNILWDKINSFICSNIKSGPR